MAYKDKNGEIWLAENDIVDHALAVENYKKIKEKRLKGLRKYWEENKAK